MTFDNLYDTAVESLALGWLAQTQPTDKIQELSMMLSNNLTQKLNTFVLENPEHPISTTHTVVPDSLNIEYNLAQDNLWRHYLELRTKKSPVDDKFYDLMDNMIEVTKKMMQHKNVSHPIMLNEHNFASPELILSTIEKMVTICKKAIDKKIKNTVPEFKQKTKEDIEKLIKPFDPEINYMVGSKNGSFMTPIEIGNSKIHIAESDDVNDMFESFAHEIGHALYQTRFLNKYTEVGKIGGMLSISLHESSSIFHEMVLGNINFNIDPSARYNVRRLGADRLHYILHIYIRTKIEHEIFVNNLTARQIPDLWNSLMKEYIGLVPQDEWEGFMQDVHWASGAFGYFHSYAIGMLNAVDMMQSPRVIEKLKYVDDSDYKKIIEDIILPEIENRYGRFNEFSKDTFEQMYFGCMNSLVDRFENFVEEKFNVV